MWRLPSSSKVAVIHRVKRLVDCSYRLLELVDEVPPTLGRPLRSSNAIVIRSRPGGSLTYMGGVEVPGSACWTWFLRLSSSVIPGRFDGLGLRHEDPAAAEQRVTVTVTRRSNDNGALGKVGHSESSASIGPERSQEPAGQRPTAPSARRVDTPTFGCSGEETRGPALARPNTCSSNLQQRPHLQTLKPGAVRSSVSVKTVQRQPLRHFASRGLGVRVPLAPPTFTQVSRLELVIDLFSLVVGTLAWGKRGGSKVLHRDSGASTLTAPSSRMTAGCVFPPSRWAAPHFGSPLLSTGRF